MTDLKKAAPDAAREPAHPLADALADALKVGAGRGPVLLLGVGSGRNIRPFVAAGIAVEGVEPDPDRAESAAARFRDEPLVRIRAAPLGAPLPGGGGLAGALSTHALLHAHAPAPAMLASVAERLAPGAPFYFTLGSVRDPRFGRGTRLDEWTWAPAAGSEIGVPHAYFTRGRIDELLRGWEIDSVDERSAAETVGRWAHGEAESATMVHWFVRVRRR